MSSADGHRSGGRIRARWVLLTAAFIVAEVVLVVTGTGTIPLPTNIHVTILELPAVLAAVLIDPIAGVLVGAAFGLTSFAAATTPLFQNALVAIGPRLVIGIVAYVTYRGVRPVNESLALAAAGAAGAVANTGLVLLLAAIVPAGGGITFLPPSVAWTVALATVPSEAAVSAVLTAVLGSVLRLAADRLG
jgi:uncharacterized membrane protein